MICPQAAKMRTKVYGKKARAGGCPRSEYNATLSPERKSGSLRGPALAEKSGNIRRTPWRTERLQAEPKADVPPESAKKARPPPAQPVDLKREDDAGNASQKPSEPVDEEVLDSFARLQMKDSQPPPEVQVPQKVVQTTQVLSPVRSQPVALDAATATYLNPLLSLKHVQPHVEAFAPWLAARCAGLALAKIGEGSFGEVYRAAHPSDTPISGATSSSTAILKLVPLNAPRGPNSRCFTAVAAAAAEVHLLQRMQRVPGFVAFRGACVLRGAMPARLGELWAEFQRGSTRTVASRDPRGKKAYPSTQLWLLIEMADAGRSLEAGEYEPPSKDGPRRRDDVGPRLLEVRRTWDIWWQVVKAVAKAEVYAEFEHRDLHLGNICAKDPPGCAGRDCEDLEMVDEDSPVRFPLHETGVEVTVIDYTLSRAKFGSKTSGDEVVWTNFLADEDLFAGQGHAQYDMYRYMAQVVGDRSAREFVPETNVIWLYYLLWSLMDVTAGLSAKAKATRNGRATKAAIMGRTLEGLQDTLNPAQMHTWEIRSAGGLLDLGVLKGLFSAEDVMDR